MTPGGWSKWPSYLTVKLMLVELHKTKPPTKWTNMVKVHKWSYLQIIYKILLWFDPVTNFVSWHDTDFVLLHIYIMLYIHIEFQEDLIKNMVHIVKNIFFDYLNHSDLILHLTWHSFGLVLYFLFFLIISFVFISVSRHCFSASSSGIPFSIEICLTI